MGSEGAAAAGDQGDYGDATGTSPYPDSGAAGGPAQGGMTAEETLGSLDEQFDASLGVFDGMVLTERQAAQTMGTAAADNATAGDDGEEGYGDDVAANDEPLFEEADLSESGAEGDEATVPPMSGEQGGTNTIAGAPGSGHGAIPPDLVDGSDDDIVARQIREAAMNEPDPELREKLWEEYRKYKKGK